MLGFILVMTGFSQAAETDLPETKTEVFANYDLGDNFIMLNVGTMIPLFFQDTSGKTYSSNLTPGVQGSLRWISYLNPVLNIGADLNGFVTFSPNLPYLAASLTGLVSYDLRVDPLLIPLHFGIGATMSSFAENLAIDLTLKAGTSLIWAYDSSWSFGLNLFYWWIPQIYTGPTPPASDTRFGNFLEITLSAMYHL